MQPYHWLAAQYNSNVTSGLPAIFLQCRWWQYGQLELGCGNMANKQDSWCQ
jgi:hypothetical protein